MTDSDKEADLNPITALERLNEVMRDAMHRLGRLEMVDTHHLLSRMGDLEGELEEERRRRASVWGLGGASMVRPGDTLEISAEGVGFQPEAIILHAEGGIPPNPYMAGTFYGEWRPQSLADFRATMDIGRWPKWILWECSRCFYPGNKIEQPYCEACEGERIMCDLIVEWEERPHGN